MADGRRRSFLRALLITGAVGTFFFLSIFALTYLLERRQHFGQPKVAIIEIRGVIADSGKVIQQIRQHLQNPTVRAFVFRIDSPGGAVAPSQEIYQEIRRLITENGRPVVVSMGTVAASGGYYIASAAKWVYASPGTITGSIGVIMQIPNVSELLSKVGIRTVTVKSGRYKDIASATRDLSAEERRLLQQVIDDIHEQFIQAVVDARGLPRQTVEAIADGRIMSGRQALALKLVDQLGTLQDAIAKAGELSGIPGEPETVQIAPRGFSLLGWLLGQNRSRWMMDWSGRQHMWIGYLWAQ